MVTQNIKHHGTFAGWKARPRKFDGETFHMVFQGRVKDFKEKRIQEIASKIRLSGHKARIIKIKTYRGMEWVIYEK